MSDSPCPDSYRVLARKYRPATFAELVGQDAMVRTLANAFELGRIAQAFILTGVRGVGKTTTARIIAKALNCIGPEGTGGPTISPCGECEPCRAIAEDRHVDVLEIDGASHAGVDQIRDLIDSVRYLPASARFKVYIVDEVHMLSKQAFNALLKTLEEPPPHVKFVFATTEIRKVPVTVLSRCQRFDLRRLDGAELADHLRAIASKEEAPIDDDALDLIARAAEGSVRDGLSLLDQAIAFAENTITAPQIRDMLGLADRAEIIDLFEHLHAGRMPDALALVRKQYGLGADPLVIVQDLLAFTHWLTRLKVAPGALGDLAATEAERERGKEIAGALGVAELTRTWQILLKGLDEVLNSPLPLAALEMAMIRLAFAADLPVPAELVRDLKGAPAPAPAPASAPAPATAPPPSGTAGGAAAALAHDADPAGDESPAPPPPVPTAQSDAPSGPPTVENFRDAVQLAADRGELRLYANLRTDVHVVRFESGSLEIRLGAQAPRNLPNRLGQFLEKATGRRWVVSVSNQEGAATLEDQDAATRAERHAQAAAHPLVRKVLETFPGAEIRAVRDVGPDTGEFVDPSGEEEDDS